MVRKGKDSEYPSYRFILNDLKEHGWDIRNPNRSPEGQVYTQNECLSDPRIKKQLDKLKPENVVKLSESKFYVIEAKPKRTDIEKAMKEAEKDYADAINASSEIQAPLISAVAGNEVDGYLVKSKFLENGKWKPIKINGKELTSLVYPEIANQLLTLNKAEIDEIPVDERVFLATAERVNKILHQGAINKDYRARVMASLLLALIDNTPLNLDESPSILISSINSRVNAVLEKEGKPSFFPFIKIDLPASTENHVKFKKALVLTIQELLGLNIRSAMNSGTDVLGKFYEVFLRYGNGAKEIGIVLTPRHVTQFACELLDINVKDIIFDPTCGTGGFLVSAFDHVKKTSKASEIDNFKQNNIFGIEQQDGIVALALVNMIFRGDGKSNIVEGDCFKRWLNLKRIGGVNTAEYLEKDSSERIPPISKVLMNPPFALKNSDEKEYRFIEHTLNQMRDGGLLFSVLPTSSMVKQGGYLNWRREILLRENTLLAVITFPPDLFYPVGVETCAIILKKGVPHSSDQKTLWLKTKSDGFVKSKGKRLPSGRVKNEFADMREIVQKFIADQNTEIENVEEFIKVSTIDFTDKNLELLPEVYLDEKKPTTEELRSRMDTAIKETVAFMVKYGYLPHFKKEVVEKDKNFFSSKTLEGKTKLVEIPITDIFVNPIKTGEYHVSGILDEGNIPLVSCVSDNGGFEGFFDVDLSECEKNSITIASDGSPLSTFFHFYPYVAKDNVLICKPKKDYRFTTLMFIAAQLNSLKWRFSYGRKCYENKVHKIKIYLPMTNEGIDEDHIEALFKSSESWELLRKLF